VTWEGRLTFEVSSADPDSASPVWVDLTSRILDPIQQVEVGIGRQNDLEQSEPTVWTMVLNNADDALTYGNPLSPYAAWWGPGRKCRLRETVGGFVMDLATGYLQVPSELVALSGIEQRVSVSIVDRLGDLAASEPFISTLAAHIRYAGGSVLKVYMPMNDAPNVTDLISGRTLTPITASVGGPGGYRFGSTLVNTSGAIALADDISSVATVVESASAGSEVGRMLDFGSGGLPVGTGDVVTVVCWAQPTQTADPNYTALTPHLFTAQMNESTPTASGFMHVRSTAGVWQADYGSGGMTGTVTGRNVGYGDPVMVAIRYGFNPATLELWLGDDVYVGSLAGAPPVSALMNSIRAFDPLVQTRGGMSHFQIYIGAPSAWSYADYQAQRRVGLLGLQRQTTGDRIRTIAQYAGIPAAELTQIDTGQSVMAPARLAGRTPLDAMREAETTEQGLLFVDGSGNLIFKDRRSLDNV
jgi:hypothetical protein